MMENEKLKKKFGGVPINAVTVPMVAILAVLHVMIVVVILMVNNASAGLSDIMQDSAAYVTDATSLQAGSSRLSETSTAFVMTPVLEDGTFNTGPLMGYVEELGLDRRGDQVVALFEDRDISDAARAELAAAAQSANAMLQTQIHAISLVKSVYTLPDIPMLSAIPEVELTGEELAMSPGQRLGMASAEMIGLEYTQQKQIISESINACVDDIRAAASAHAAVAGRRIGMLRTLLWAVTVTIVLMLTCFFIMLYRQLIFPLNGFSKLIASNDSLDETEGLREVRVLASAYNALLKRRDALDSILRSAAETDALTNLPNRYRFEQYLLESAESGYSMAMFLFDINYLKQTNDTLGHLAGDKLIRDAAECISSCFGNSPEGCCFRFGGDEFAAIWKNCDPQAIREKIRRFHELEKEKDVSISMGYAYTENVGNTTFKQLLDEADRQMYARKKAAHMEHDKVTE